MLSFDEKPSCSGLDDPGRSAPSRARLRAALPVRKEVLDERFFLAHTSHDSGEPIVRRLLSADQLESDHPHLQRDDHAVRGLLVL